ncbi:MAG: HlyD family efflux transporter periplasmic adaptor subunit [Planctomycetota bacterium]
MANSGTIRTPLSQQWQRFRQGGLPLVIWLCAAGGMLFMLADRRAERVYLGLAREVTFEVSAVRAGELKELRVGLYQTVAEGEAVALLREDDLEGAIHVAREELERLAAELRCGSARIRTGAEADRIRGAQDYLGLLRRYLMDENTLAIEAMQVQVQATSDELEADRIEVQLNRSRRLLEDEVSSAGDVDDLMKLHQKALGGARENRKRLAALNARLELARGRTQDLTAATPRQSDLEDLLAGMRAAVKVQQARIDVLEQKRRSLLLRAPVSGQVARVLARPGQAVLAGEPVLELIGGAPDEVVLYVPAGAAESPRLSQRMLISRISAPAEQQEAVVQCAAPALAELPPQLWRNPEVREYGRAYLVGPVRRMNLVAGETVRISPVPGD